MSLKQRKLQRELLQANHTISAKQAKIAEKSRSFSNNLQIVKDDAERVVSIMNNAPSIVHNIDAQFEMATSLKKKDIAFLFAAAAIQVARWALLPAFDFTHELTPSGERMSALEGGKIEQTGITEYLKNQGFSDAEIRMLMDHDHIEKYTWEKLLIAPVPYDAMSGTEKVIVYNVSNYGKNLYGKNHHAATWGHDPIFGWVFGPLNITARMISFRNQAFETRYVRQIQGTFRQEVTYRTTNTRMIQKSFNSWSEDGRCLFAAVAKQGLHLQSDKYTKTGLPIPFINPQTAQELLMKGWNSVEVEKLFKKAMQNLAIVGAQLSIAMVVDQVISAGHLLCYDPSVDGSISLYKGRTQKIICYSNWIAEIANAGYVLTTGNLTKADIGGYLNLARNLVANVKYQQGIKAKFLQEYMEKELYGDDYYFAEV